MQHLPHHLLCELYKLLPADGASRRAFAHSCRDAHDAVGGAVAVCVARRRV